MNNPNNSDIVTTDPMASPPRRPSNSLPPQLPDPLATPRSFLRNNSSSATPSLIATPPPPFKYSLPLTNQNNIKDNNNIPNANVSGNADNIFAGSPMFMTSPYYDARTSMGSTISSSTNLKLEDKLRYWRHDAYLKNLYDTAAFWGNKVMTITG